MVDLNKVLDYSLIAQSPSVSAAAQAKINAHIIVDHNDWGKSFSKDFIAEVKVYYARKQGRKCAFCRSTINHDGYAEAVEHLTARQHKPHWMFVLHNLTVCCTGCNSSKGTTNMLRYGINTYGHIAANCPAGAVEYLCFNPHVDRWSDHFEVEDGFMLIAKRNTKGPFTYKELNMKRYNIILDYIDQLQFRLKNDSFKILNKRIRKEKNPEILAALKKALDTIEQTI